MKAIMEMRAEPLFGGQVTCRIEAEVHNARLLTNTTLFTEMSRSLRHMGEELQAESELVLDQDGHGQGTRRAQARELTDEDLRERERERVMARGD